MDINKIRTLTLRFMEDHFKFLGIKCGVELGEMINGI